MILLALFVLAPDKHFASRAIRCSECHEVIYDDWKSSAHARAAVSPLYKQLQVPGCERCHAPLPAPLAAEGVSCDACHMMRRAQAGEGAKLELQDNIKYGPLCDAKAHYFHKMGCSPLHEQAKLCGACHQAEGHVADFAEWKESSAADEVQACQSCHMPGLPGEAAKGARRHQRVPKHTMRPVVGVTLDYAVTPTADGAQLALTLTNAHAGHGLPAGSPERRLVVRVDNGQSVQERSIGRVLQDERGQETAFTRAHHIGEDTRLQPGQSLKWDVAVARGPKLLVQVLWRPMTPELAASLGLGAPEDRVLLQAKLGFTAKKGRL